MMTFGMSIGRMPIQTYSCVGRHVCPGALSLNGYSAAVELVLAMKGGGTRIRPVLASWDSRRLQRLARRSATRSVRLRGRCRYPGSCSKVMVTSPAASCCPMRRRPLPGADSTTAPRCASSPAQNAARVRRGSR